MIFIKWRKKLGLNNLLSMQQENFRQLEQSIKRHCVGNFRFRRKIMKIKAFSITVDTTTTLEPGDILETRLSDGENDYVYDKFGYVPYFVVTEIINKNKVSIIEICEKGFREENAIIPISNSMYGKRHSSGNLLPVECRARKNKAFPPKLRAEYKYTKGKWKYAFKVAHVAPNWTMTEIEA